jgi:hypothetical protein
MARPQLGLAAAASIWLLAGACADTPTWTPSEGQRRSLGAELYVVLCDRVAASEMPEDVRGHRSNDICHREATPVEDTPPRLRAMAENRARLVSALDAALTSGSLDDDLGTFLTELLPFYEPPRELLPEVTRGFADVVARMSTDAQALEAFQRMSARRGYRPLEHAVGLFQAVLKYPRLHEFLVAFLGAIGPDGKAHDAWTTLSSALALELASYEAKPAGTESVLDVTDKLFFSGIDDGLPATNRFLARRDARGLVRPQKLCSDGSCMFADADQDGAADMDPLLGTFRAGGAPTPFPVLGLADVAKRDAFRRALDDDDAPLYDYIDVSRTFGGGFGRELLPLLEPDDQGRTIVLDLADALDVLLGPRTDANLAYDRASLAHRSRDTKLAVGLDLVPVMSVVGRSPDVVPLLDVVGRLVRDHEPQLAALVKGLLDAKALANDSDAAFAMPNEFWDDVLGYLQLMARTSRTPGHETMFEGVMRAIADERAKHFGDVVAMMLRHKDQLYLDQNDINNLPKGSFLTPVDRDRPDTADNRSIMQRSLHLVGEIDGQRGICNKQLLLIQPCSVMDYDDLGRVMGGAMSEEWELELGLGLNGLLAAIDAVRGTFTPGTPSTLGEIMGIEGLDDHPSPQALSRLLLGDIALVDLLIDPILVRNAPNDSEQYWLKRAYANTIEAWEVPLDFADGTRVSFWDAFRPLAEAFNRHDYDPRDAEHANDEHSFFLYMELASTFGRFYGSAAGGHGTDPNGPFFNVGANARAFEGILADMVSSGTLVPTPCTPEAEAQNRCWVTEETVALHGTNLGIFIKLHDILKALDGIELADGRDGIDVMAGLLELMLNPHKACDPSGTGLVNADGTGACDRPDAPYPPLEIRRRGGEQFAKTNIGDRYDGTLQARAATWNPLIQDLAGRPLVENSTPHLKNGQARLVNGATVPYTPRRYVSPLLLVLGTLNDVDASFETAVLPRGDERLLRWRHARSGLVDRFFATDGVSFENRTGRALLLSILDFAKERFERHQTDGDLDPWLASLEGRAESFARTPLISSTIDLLNASQEDPALQKELSALLAYMFDGTTSQQSFDTTMYALLDFVQVLRDDTNMVPMLAAVSRFVAPNTPEAVKNGEPLALEDGALERATALMRDVLRVDEYSSLSVLLQNLVTTHEAHQQGKETPLETLVDVVAEVNRANPDVDQGKQMRAADFKTTFEQLRSFLLDERRGLERLYDIVQHRADP